MPVYSFKERFIEPIKKGEKNQTIRGKRKHQAKPGDTLYLYYGMRTKYCMKIKEVICKKVEEIKISAKGIVMVGGKKMDWVQKHAIAKADGFENFDEMLQWWKQNNTLPFVGDIIYW